MPEIYDPNNGSRFRSRRRRKRNNNSGNDVTAGLLTIKPSDGPTPPPPEKSASILKKQHGKYYNKEQTPTTKDPLEFCETNTGNDNDNDNDDVLSSQSPNDKDNVSSTTWHKNRVVTVMKTATTTTKKKIPSTDKRTSGKPVAAGATPLLSSPVVAMESTKTRTTFTSCDAANENTFAIRSTQSRSNRNSVRASLRYAVCLDTRYLDTKEGKADQDDLQLGVKGFLQSSFRRGLNPSIITWTEQSDTNASTSSSSSPMRNVRLCTNNISKRTNSIRIRSGSLVEDDIDTTTWNGTPIRPPINHGNTNRSVVHLPKGLKANNTWKIFGDLGTYCIRYYCLFSSYKCKRLYIKNIYDKVRYRLILKISYNTGIRNLTSYSFPLSPVKAAIDYTNSSGTPSATPTPTTPASKRSNDDLHEEPLRVVIFTKDTSSLLDTNQAAHQRGIDAFWENVRGEFSNGKVQSIQIVVVMGETMIVRTTKECNSVNCGGGEDEENKQKQEQEQDQENVEKESTDDNSDNNNNNNNNNGSVDSNQSETDSVEKLSGIIKTIEYYIQTKIEEDFKTNRSRIQFDTKSETYARMDISLTTVDNTVGFHSLCQKWSREVVAVIENNGRRLPTLCFQLPETSDFDACEISFLASYKCMPFRLDSKIARNLYADLELLSRAKVEVLQLVPIASIDASLIYGIAIGLKAALENNEDEHQEKILLVQSLLKHLVTKDCALLIRSNGPDDEGGLFHSSESQYFLFMPEFVLSKDGPASNSGGVLHRMASIDHILDEANDMDALTLSRRQEEEDIPVDNNPFSEYIEASLELLDFFPLNPWFQDSLDMTGASDRKRVTWKEENSSVSKCTSEEQIINGKGWTDDSGIGSLVDEAGDKSNEKENEKGQFTSSKERKVLTHPTSLKGNKDILDDVEHSDDELMVDSDDELMVDSSAVTQDSKRQRNKLVVPKPKNHQEECAEMEWNGSDDSSSLGGSIGDSDSSSNDSTLYGTFDYTH
jgi:hypothetical protein